MVFAICGGAGSSQAGVPEKLDGAEDAFIDRAGQAVDGVEDRAEDLLGGRSGDRGGGGTAPGEHDLERNDCEASEHRHELEEIREHSGLTPAEIRELLGNAAGDPCHAHEHGHEHGHEASPRADFQAHSGSRSGELRERAAARSRPRGAGGSTTGHATGRTLSRTTVRQTITGGDANESFQFLRRGPGEARVVRTELAKAKPGRAKRRRSLLYMAQTTDWQLADEESPARVEFVDATANAPFPKAFSAAWRPQEAFGPFAVESSIRQLNEFAERSPHLDGDGDRSEMDLAILTGDQADNQQLNETDWVVTLLEGGQLDPNSGVDPASCPPRPDAHGPDRRPREVRGCPGLR